MKARWLAIFGTVCLSSVSSLSGGEGAWKQVARLEEAGWSSEKLAAARAFAETLNSAAVMAVYRGKVVAAWGDPARRIELHSARKSLVSALFGPLVASGRLDLAKTLGDFGIDDLQPLTEDEKKAKISDLLAARSGVYHPAAKETRDVKANRPARGSHRPGEFWWYNNWDFNTAGAVFERAAGRGLFGEFETRIARPLGMEDFRAGDGYLQFERGLSRYPAHAFRMSARDLARFGQLFLDGGRRNGQEVIPESWIRESTRMHSEVREGTGYGYMWWVYPKGGLGKSYPELDRCGQFAAIGSGGQLLLVVPDAGYVFVHLADTGAGQEVSGKNVWRLAEMILESKIAEPAGEPVTVDLAPIPFKSGLPPEKSWKEVALPAPILAKYAGDYRADSGMRISFRVLDTFLIGAVPGLGEWDFLAESETEFFIKSEGATVRFISNESGRVSGCILTLSGKPLSLVKEK
jgi:CubicO group peptidase (beta-lactamase class C family)